MQLKKLPVRPECTAIWYLWHSGQVRSISMERLSGMPPSSYGSLARSKWAEKSA